MALLHLRTRQQLRLRITMAFDRQLLIFFIILFIFFLLPNGNDQPHLELERDTLVKFQDSLDRARKTVASNQYNRGYGNLTGFLLSYEDSKQGKSVKDWPLHEYNDDLPWLEDKRDSILPNEVSNEVKKFWGNDVIDMNDDTVGYLLNISGASYGHIEKKDAKIERVNFQLPEYLQKYYESVMNAAPINDDDKSAIPEPAGQKDGNVTFTEGRISLKFESPGYNYQNHRLDKLKDEDRVDNAVVVNVRTTFMDNPEYETTQLETKGVYFQHLGSLVTVTSSAKFLGNHGLPHLTMEEDNFKIAQKLMGQLFNSSSVEDTSMDNMNTFVGKAFQQCEFINFIQLEKSAFTIKELREIDEELANPTGRPLPDILPEVQVKEALFYSPDCGIILHKKPASVFTGNKREVTLKQCKMVYIALLAVIIAQFYIFFSEIKVANTPGHASNVSSATLMMFGFEDSLLALECLMLGDINQGLFLLISCIVLALYIMCWFFEMGFLTFVLLVQLNERGTTWWEILRGSNRQESADTPEPTEPPAAGQNAETETAAATPAAGTTPAAAADMGIPDTNVWNSIFGPGVFVVIVSSFFVLYASTWRKKFRFFFEVVSLFFINSFWIPQFLRCTLKNRKAPFTPRFIIGSSILRLVPVLYLNLFTNPFRHDRHVVFATMLSLWVSFQVVLLYVQARIGPRFWINDKWLPQAYNYHPIITLKDLEKGYGSDLLAEVDVETTDGDIIDCKTDCVICMTPVNLPIVKGEVPKKLNATSYMITPCFHVFHSECLEDWMNYKLQCPVCRNGLPPV